MNYFCFLDAKNILRVFGVSFFIFLGTSFPDLLTPLEKENPFGHTGLKISAQDLHIQDEIEFSENANRPTLSHENKSFILSFPKMNKTIKVALHQKLFLTRTQGKLENANENTGLILEINREIDQGLECTLFIQLSKKLQDSMLSIPTSIKMIFPVVSKKPESIERLPFDHPIVKLSKSQFLAPDSLEIMLKKESSLSKRYRILINQDSGIRIFPVMEKTFLIFKNNQWQELESLKENQSDSMAVVKKISERQLELECWDETGTKRFLISLNLFEPPGFIENFQQIFSSIRLKTKYQVSVQAGKQLLFLRVGDGIIINNANSFEIVKNVKLNEKSLKNAEGKPFLFFNQILQQKAKKIFMGTFFDATRSRAFKVQLPICFTGDSYDTSLTKNQNTISEKSHSMEKR